MVYFNIHCDPLPGKEEDLDNFLTNSSKSFWMSQHGVKNFHVYGDKLLGWPERTIMIELENMSSLQNILDSTERKQLRKQFMNQVSRVESQIQDIII